MDVKGQVVCLLRLNQLLKVQSRWKHVPFTPRLKEILQPPPPKAVKKRPEDLPPIESIKIPLKVERSPTDILKALSNTVGKDYTAAHYKFHDDPYLIPYSNMAKRNFALSKESGRKAAKWVRDQHADLFQHQIAEPPIEMFFPSPVFTEESKVTEEDLNYYIEKGLFQESMKIYEILRTKGEDVSDATKQSFLELLCYFNEIEPVDEDLVEERWYRQANFLQDRAANTWKDNGVAETLFQQITNPSAITYCTMIRGQAKFFNPSKAWNTYSEAISKGLVLDTETYNSVLRICNFLKENADLRLQLLEELLVSMKELGIPPNLGTLNAVLDSLSIMGNARQAKAVSLSVIAEFKDLGIMPSLASYYYLLRLFCKEKGPTSNILVDILRTIKGQEFTIHHPKDVFFFVTAMDVARNHLFNVDVAHDVNELLHTGNNYDLIGDSFKESVYYRHYLVLSCASEPFDDFMAFYTKIVPSVYTPEPAIMEEILKAVEINQAVDYVPQLWSDIVMFDQTNRENLLSLLLHVMSIYHPTKTNNPSDDLSNKLTNISWEIWKIVETQDKDRPRRTNWTGKMLGDLISVQIAGDNFENACEVVKKLISPEAASEVVGVPSVEALQLFLENAIVNNDGPMCLMCLYYIKECGFSELPSLSKEVYKRVKLDKLQNAKLSDISGLPFDDPSKEDTNVAIS